MVINLYWFEKILKDSLCIKCFSIIDYMYCVFIYK